MNWSQPACATPCNACDITRNGHATVFADPFFGAVWHLMRARGMSAHRRAPIRSDPIRSDPRQPVALQDTDRREPIVLHPPRGMERRVSVSSHPPAAAAAAAPTGRFVSSGVAAGVGGYTRNTTWCHHVTSSPP